MKITGKPGLIVLLLLAFSLMHALAFAQSKGYELLYNKRVVGHEPSWDAGAAVNNLLWNIETRSDIDVTGRFNGKEINLPERISVLPVFYVPKGETLPTEKQKKKLDKHLNIAQERYRVLLNDRDTFLISKKGIIVYESCNALGALREDVKHEALKLTAELIGHLGYDRFSLPYVLLIVVMNPYDDVPVGGGRPINGGVNRGGGIVLLSSYALDNAKMFQSTLQHELGHSFGLLHVNEAYGYDLKSNDSIMSYNLAHHWDGFKKPKQQGILLPEEIKLLSKNKRVLKQLVFEPDSDIPKGYKIKDSSILLGPMNIPTDAIASDGCWK